jgi:hypothetical protein
MKLGLQRWGMGGALAIAGALGTAAIAGVPACNLTPAQDASLVATIEGAACQVAEAVPSDPAWVPVVCQVVSTVTGGITTIAVKVPKSQVPAFLAANPAPDGGLPGLSKTVKKPGF